jgi:hypothetical protein
VRAIKARARCSICGHPPTLGDPLVAHHDPPMSQGGSHDRMTPVHVSCHEREHARRRRT